MAIEQRGGLIFLDLHGGLWEGPDNLKNNSNITKKTREKLDQPLTDMDLPGIITPMSSTLDDSVPELWHEFCDRVGVPPPIPERLARLAKGRLRDRLKHELTDPQEHANIRQTRLDPYKLRPGYAEILEELSTKQKYDLVICSAMLAVYELLLAERMTQDGVWRFFAHEYFVPGLLRTNPDDFALFPKMVVFRIGSEATQSENRDVFRVLENEIRIAEAGTAFYDNVEFHLPISPRESREQRHISPRYLPRKPDRDRIILDSGLDRIATEGSPVNTTVTPLSYIQSPAPSVLTF